MQGLTALHNSSEYLTPRGLALRAPLLGAGARRESSPATHHEV